MGINWKELAYFLCLKCPSIREVGTWGIEEWIDRRSKWRIFLLFVVLLIISIAIAK